MVSEPGAFCALGYVWAVCEAGVFISAACALGNLLPFGHVIPPFGGVGTPVRRAVSLNLDDASSFLLPFGHVIPPSGGVGTPVRRAARRGRLWGYAPFSAHLASPPKHPLKKGFQLPQNGEGNAAIAAGASFPRYAPSGDLPPRRVNARIRFLFDQYPFQPIISALAISASGKIPLAIKNWSWSCLPYTRRSGRGGDGWCWANLQNTRFAA